MFHCSRCFCRFGAECRAVQPDWCPSSPGVKPQQVVPEGGVFAIAPGFRFKSAADGDAETLFRGNQCLWCVGLDRKSRESEKRSKKQKGKTHNTLVNRIRQRERKLPGCQSA